LNILFLKNQLIFKLSIFTNVKNSWLSLVVLTNWLLNLFYSTNEVCSVYSRMCIQNIFQFNTIVCHIFFATKCGHVLYIHKLKGSHPHINVNTLGNIQFWDTFITNKEKDCTLSYAKVSFHIEKTNNFFLNYKIFHHLLWYCDMSSEIIQGVAYYTYDDFQHVNFIFFTKFHFTILGII